MPDLKVTLISWEKGSLREGKGLANLGVELELTLQARLCSLYQTTLPSLQRGRVLIQQKLVEPDVRSRKNAHILYG